MASIATRRRLLGSWPFIASVATLLLNDHVLKARFPGWWTGKLSDVAGVAMVALAASVLLGARAGVSTAALGFCALKTVPGVAELARPILGGVTLRDTSDLVALIVLLPVGWWMVRRVEQRVSTESRDVSERGSDFIATARQGVTAAVPILASVVAVVATTATSCSPDPAAFRLVVVGDSVFAEIDRINGNLWLGSNDGGNTWNKQPQPASASALPAAPDEYGQREPVGPTEACVSNDDCFRLVERRRIERQSTDVAPTTVFSLTDAEYQAIGGGCTNNDLGVLSSVVVVRGNVIATLGADGVVVGTPDGRWTRINITRFGIPTPPSGALAASTVFGPLAAIPIALIFRRRFPSWRLTSVAAIACSIGLAGLLTLLIQGEPGPTRWLWPFGPVAAIGSLTLGLRSRRSRPGSMPPWPGIGQSDWPSHPPRFPVVIVSTFVAHQQRRSELLTALEQMSRLTAQCQGCIRCDVEYDNDDPLRLRMIERWASGEHRAARPDTDLARSLADDVARLVTQPVSTQRVP
jgi:quinol monooxygenase YgiN